MSQRFTVKTHYFQKSSEDLESLTCKNKDCSTRRVDSAPVSTVRLHHETCLGKTRSRQRG